MSETDFVNGYDYRAEDLFVSFMFSNADLYARCKAITKPEFFDDRWHQAVISFLAKYTNENNQLPTQGQVEAVTGKKVIEPGADVMCRIDWFLREYELFCRYKSLRDAIYESTDLLKENKFGEVEALVKSATQIGLVKDLGTDYFKDAKGRLEHIKNSRAQISTGWKSVDDKLYGGLNRGEITIFAGQPGAGKSLFLQNLAANWVMAGFNIVYISLELSENLCSMRVDAMFTGYETREILKNIDDVALRVGAIKKKHHGNLIIKQLPNGCTTNDVRAYVKELEIQSGYKIDGIVIDYLDLMMPVDKKISPSDMFVKDKYVSENLRNLAIDLDILMATASQLNRGSYEDVDYDPSHIAGGISKVNTADNVIGIFTSIAMKENGRYQIQFIKTRSSAGVGSRVDLNFNNKSLRITDLEEGMETAITTTTKNLLNDLKRSGTIKETTEIKKEPAPLSDTATALRGFLKKK